MSTKLAMRISIVCALIVAILTLFLAWPNNAILYFDEFVASFNAYQTQPGLVSVAEVLDDFGRRVFVLPLMIVVLILAGRKLRSWRPLLLGIGAFVAASLVVGSLKFVTARTSPRIGGGEFGVPELVDTIGLYPSGHAANAVVAWGAMVYFSSLAWSWTKERTQLASILVVGIIFTLGLASGYLQYHWVSDLVGGALVGASALFAAIALDQKVRAPAAFATRARTNA